MNSTYRIKKFISFLVIIASIVCLISVCGCSNEMIDYPFGIETVPYPNDTDNKQNGETTKDTSSPYVEPPKETRISFIATGDNIIHENVFLDARSRAKDGEAYNFFDMYTDGIKALIANADIAFVNQETPICGDELGVSGYPKFNSPEAVGDTLIDLGFDIVNIANNHMLDKGEKGYEGQLDYWDKRDIMQIGGYRNKSDYENIRVYEEKGVKIAFISYTFINYGIKLPSSSELYVPYTEQNEIVSMTKKAGEIADLVFVVMHWGEEYKFRPSKSQITLAQAITEAGADVIIGSHTHSIQPVEWLTASDGSKTLVTYSLGNILSTQYNNFSLVGGIISFDIVKNDGGISIEKPIFNPVITHYNQNRLGLQVYMMEDYSEDLVKLHGNPRYGETAEGRQWTMEKIRSLVTDNVSREFLPDFLK